MKTIWRNVYVWMAVAVALYMGLFLLFPAFNIIDDGATLLVADKLKSNLDVSTWSTTLVEQQVGRFRPMYHLSLFAVYALFGMQPFFFWLSQALVLWGTLAAMVFFLKQDKKHHPLVWLSPLLLLFFSPVAENFYRLGTAEPKQILVWSWLLVVLAVAYQKGWNVMRGVVFAGLFLVSCLIKETSLFFAAMVGYQLVWAVIFERRKPWAPLAVTIVCAAIVFGVYQLIPSSGSYSSGFAFDLADIKQRLLAARLEYAAAFFPLVVMVLGTAARFLVSWWWQRKISWSAFFWQGLLLSQLVLMMVIGILPWQYQLPRYYYPIYVMVSLYVALEVAAWRVFWPAWQKLSLKMQLGVASTVVAAAWLLQKTLFQSAVGLRLAESVWRQNAWVLLWEAAPLIVALWVAIGSSLVRQLLAWDAKASKTMVAGRSLFWPIWFAGAWVATMLLSVVPWHEHWPRALFTSNLVLAAYFVYEVSQWQSLARQKWFAKVGIGPVLSFTLGMLLLVGLLNRQFLAGRGLNAWPFVGPTVTALRSAFDTHQVSYALIRRLLTNTPEGAHVFVSSADYEIIFEIGLYASQLKHRPVTIYTNNQQLLADVGQDFPYLQYVPDPIQAFTMSPAPRLLLLRKMTWEVLTSTESAAAVEAKLVPQREAANWAQFRAEEASPAASLYTIPNGANWVIVQ